MKAETDLKQSKKLAEGILPIESADKYWWSSGKRYYIESMDDGDFNEKEGHIRAWSLAALLDAIPQEIFDGEYIINITGGLDYKWVITYDSYNHRDHSYYGISASADDLIDACYEIILKLHERKLL